MDNQHAWSTRLIRTVKWYMRARTAVIYSFARKQGKNGSWLDAARRLAGRVGFRI
jgi:hypothetical protein